MSSEFADFTLAIIAFMSLFTSSSFLIMSNTKTLAS